jgi:hypothetical protein
VTKPPKRPRDPAQLAKLIVDIATGEFEDREPTPEERGKDPAQHPLGKREGLRGPQNYGMKRSKTNMTTETVNEKLIHETVNEKLIHIEWEGPYSLKAVKSLTGDSDFGLYQVYVCHPVYGPGVLAYIGLACDQTFSARIGQHDWGSGSENDPNKVEVYVGRLKGDNTPSRQQWNDDIKLAEKLLIHSHGPAYNSTHIMDCEADPKVRNIRVLNWGAVRSLHREVSGLVWTSASGRLFGHYRPYRVAPGIP